MKQFIYFLIIMGVLLSAATFAAESAVEYTFTIQPNGETMVEAEVSGGGVILPLPEDVLTPNIQGGTYKSMDTGIRIMPATKAVVTFSTSYYTRKEEGVWYFTAPVVLSSNATVILPVNVKVIQARSKPLVAKTSQLTLTWQSLEQEIQFSYAFMGKEYVPRPDTKKLPSWLIPSLVVLGLMVVAGVGYWGYVQHKKKKDIPPSTEEHKAEGNGPEEEPKNITDAQMNILRAANPNEALVLRTILRNNGQIKRNQLEKETSLSKSSLASSLHNLEKKNILEIDRTFHVHYIALSNWFKELK